MPLSWDCVQRTSVTLVIGGKRKEQGNLVDREKPLSAEISKKEQGNLACRRKPLSRAVWCSISGTLRKRSNTCRHQ
jgi:hypothetical protein